MAVFDDFERTDDSFQRLGESLFDFLNRSADSLHSYVRTTIEQWFNNYPEEEKTGFMGDFRSGLDNKLHSRFFEWNGCYDLKCESAAR